MGILTDNFGVRKPTAGWLNSCYGSTVDPALKWGSLDDLSSAVSLSLEVLVHLQPFDRSCSSWLRNSFLLVSHFPVGIHGVGPRLDPLLLILPGYAALPHFQFIVLILKPLVEVNQAILA